MSTKRPHTLIQTCIFQLQICFSMCVLLVDIRHWRVNFELIPETTVHRHSTEWLLWGILLNLEENTCERILFLVKLQVLVCNFIKIDPHQVFCVNSAKFFDNNYYRKYVRATASMIHWINSVFVALNPFHATDVSLCDFFYAIMPKKLCEQLSHNL